MMERFIFPNQDSKHSSQRMFNQGRAWGRQENKLLLAAMPSLSHNSPGSLAHLHRVWGKKKKRPVVCVSQVLGRWGFGPQFNMWFSSGKAEWRCSRFIALIGIQCCTNITHPLILSCCVCFHMLRAVWTGSVRTISCCFCQWCWAAWWRAFWACCELFVFRWRIYTARKLCDWKAAVLTVWRQLSALQYSICLEEISLNFDALWKVKRCLMQCGKVQHWPLYWMSAWLHSHEQRLP